MGTREEIEQLNEQAYADCCALLSRGNVTLQGGGMETVKERVARLRYDAYRNSVAQTSHGSVLLQRGAFFTEEDFERELRELLQTWENGHCYEF